MSAIGPSIPGHAAAAAKFADGASSNPALAGDAGQSSPFAALFGHLVRQQAATDTAGRPLTPGIDLATADVVVDDLGALLPFMDALGMTQPALTDTLADELSDAAIKLVDGELLAATATPGAAAALSAGNPDEADLPLLAIGARPETALPGANAAQSGEAGRGHEFASQLVAAIEAGKDQPRTPGSVAAAVQQVLAATPANETQAARTPLPVAHAVGTPGWNEEVGNRIAWMASRNESRAELVLTPPQMGRVEVNLTVKGDMATASFVSASPAVREALEAALPRLREALAEAGIQLGQTQVGAEHAGQSALADRRGQSGRGAHAESGANVASSDNAERAPPSGFKSGRGLVDVYA